MTDKDLERELQELDEAVAELNAAELQLRKDALSDPWLANLFAEADAEYERKYGKPWINPISEQS